MADTMTLWRKVEKTDPSHTKAVNQRGGFTSISAHYQVMRATETFGPVGAGWGYDCGAPIFHGDFIIIPVTIWHGTRDQCFGPVYGCAEILGKRPDHDAPKKAMTDALTKALSHLGFNADVFLGKFDDNKYVAALKAEFDAPPQEAIQHACDSLASAETVDQLNAIWKGLPREVQDHQRVRQAGADRKAQIIQEQGKAA